MTSLRRTQRPNPCHLPFHIPRGRGNYPFPLAGVNGPSHSYKWIGHLVRMNEDRCCKKIFLAKSPYETDLGADPVKMD
ncbi:hypothetical protein TNCV_4747521 [Trichonephila clavipes]|nr:hypothetical protein TNCV_4747521 [Trichonephila clavipes]